MRHSSAAADDSVDDNDVTMRHGRRRGGEEGEDRKQNSEKKRSSSGSKMGEKSPPKEQKAQRRSGKGFTYEVVLLDGEHVNIELDKNADGKDLFDKVCQHLDLSEREYFGLQYVDERIPSPLKCWLSPEKKISKQKKRGPWLFDFALKFYPPDPTQLRESLTRWLVTLQTRRDILCGKLPATFLTQAMLGSYCVQADVGDYDSTEHHGIDYVRDIPFAANQTTDLLEKIVELHRQHKGQTPDEAEINYLENVKKLSMYGVDLHAAQDVNNVDIMIGVCASGLQVYRDKLRISRFVWPKILKISYKRNHFYVKVRPVDNSRLENSVSFKLASHRLAKRLWKICVEHHAFFRLREAEQPNNAAMFPRLGSKFRYSGRTLYQARCSSQNLDRPDPYFERSQPARNTYAAPTNRSRSVDELASRPDWRDDLDAGGVRRRPSDGRGEGRDKRDHMGQPTVISMLGLKPVESEQGRELEPGADTSRDGKDRQDRKPGDNDATLEREGMQGTMGLTPAELKKKAKEDEKERKKREKEEEKKRKKKGKDPTAEDRTDEMGGGDATERAPGRTPGSYADEEGEPIRFNVVAPVGAVAGEKGKGKDKDGRSPGHDSGNRSPFKDGTDPYGALWEPGAVPDVEMRNRTSPGSRDPENEDENKDRFSSFKDPGGPERWSFNKDRPKSGQDGRSPDRDQDGRSPGREGDRDRYGPGRGDDRWGPESDDRDRYGPYRDGREPYSPGREGPGRDGEGRGGDRFPPGVYGREPGRERDRDSWEPGRDGRDPGRDGRDPGRDGRDPRDSRGPYGGRDGRGPGEDGEGRGGRPGTGGYRDLPPGGDEGRYFGPGAEPIEAEKVRWAPEAMDVDVGKERKDSEKDDDKDPKKKKHRKDSDKDDDKEPKKKKSRKDSDKDDDKDPKKKKSRKDSDKDDDKDPKKKKSRKDSDKDDDKDPKKKKHRKDSDKDDKDAKKKDRKDSDKDDDKDGKKDKKKGKKDKDRKGSDKEEDKKQKGADKDHDKDKKRKDSDKDDEKDKKKDKDGDKPGKDDKEKKGGLFGKFKKPKESKTKVPEEEEEEKEGERYPGYGDDEQEPETRISPERAAGVHKAYPDSGDGDRWRHPDDDGRGRYPGDDDGKRRYPGDDDGRRRYPGDDDRRRYPDDDGRGRYPGDGRGRYPEDKDGRGRYPGDEDGRGRYPEDKDGRGRYPGDEDGRGRYPGDDGRGRYPGDKDGRGRYPGGDDGRGRYPGDDGRGRYPGDEDGRGRYPGDDGRGRYPDDEDGRGRYPGDKDGRGRYPDDKDGRGRYPGDEDGRGRYPDDGDRRRYPGDADDRRYPKGAAYPGYKPGVGPGYVPGMGVGSGDLSGVVGDETWIDNKMTFEPIIPPKKESKESLKSRQGLSDIDHTMPFFSPAATSTVGRPRSGKVPPPISPKPNSSFSFDDSFSRRDPPTVATESVQYQPDLEEVPVPTKNVPLVKTETRTVTYEREGFPFDSEEDGVLVSARSHSTRMQTIETTTYKTEKDGVQETRVEHKVVLSSTDDDFDYDAALAEAIRSVTEFNPDMSVERIECVQQIEDVSDKYSTGV
ncbi:uncharacterized protein LOC143280176 isoform X3 [Babylonia areolata]|uniref:uncharacterized protein LOC143280176 isoform X3 n=1 Tax=Babylonia areolata TaxID=304850 RepID=UPI003FD06C81